MTTPLTAAALLPRAIVHAAAAAGADVGDILAIEHMDEARLLEPDTRVSHRLMIALWEEVPRRTGDDAFGLHLAERMPRGALDVLDYALVHAATLADGYRSVLRYRRLLHDAASSSLEVDGSVARITHAFRGPKDLPRHCNEFVIATILVRGRMYLREDWAPLFVSFSHPAPADTREHRRLFRTPVHFNRPVNEVVFDRRLLDRRSPDADQALTGVLDRFAQVLLGQLPASHSLVDQVRGALLKAMSAGVPDAELTARKLGLSRRSFFRRLKEEGTSYQSVVDDLRRDVALRHLQGGQLAISEIAFMLGFSEVSAFHRAFRRWTGQSPVMYRRSLGGEPAAAGGG